MQKNTILIQFNQKEAELSNKKSFAPFFDLFLYIFHDLLRASLFSVKAAALKIFFDVGKLKKILFFQFTVL